MAPQPLQQASGPPQPLFRVLYGPRALVYHLTLVRRPRPAIILLDESLEPTHTFYASRITSVERTNGQAGCALDIHLETLSVKLGLESQDTCDALCKAITNTLGCPLYSYGNLTAAFKRAIAGGVMGGGGSCAAQATLDEILGNKTTPPPLQDSYSSAFEGSLGGLTSKFKRMELALGQGACTNTTATEPVAMPTTQFALVIDGQPCQGCVLTFKIARRACNLDFLLYKVEWRLSTDIATPNEWNETVIGTLDSLYLSEAMIGYHIKLDVYIAAKATNRRDYFKCTATTGPITMSSELCLEILANSVLDSPLLQVFIPVAHLNLVFPIVKSVVSTLEVDDVGESSVKTLGGEPIFFENNQGSALNPQEPDASDVLVEDDSPEEEVQDEQPPFTNCKRNTPQQDTCCKTSAIIEHCNIVDEKRQSELATARVDFIQEHQESEIDSQVPTSEGKLQKVTKTAKALKAKLPLKKETGAKIGRLMVKMFKRIEKVNQKPKVPLKPVEKAPTSVVAHAFGKGVNIAVAPLTLKICFKGLRLWSGAMHRDLKWQSVEILPRSFTSNEFKDKNNFSNAVELLITDPDEIKRNHIKLYASSAFDANCLWHALLFNKYKKMTIEECEEDLANGNVTRVKRVHVRILKRHAQQTNVGQTP